MSRVIRRPLPVHGLSFGPDLSVTVG